VSELVLEGCFYVDKKREFFQIVDLSVSELSLATKTSFRCAETAMVCSEAKVLLSRICSASALAAERMKKKEIKLLLELSLQQSTYHILFPIANFRIN
jgi:hypothetical protein